MSIGDGDVEAADGTSCHQSGKIRELIEGTAPGQRAVPASPPAALRLRHIPGGDAEAVAGNQLLCTRRSAPVVVLEPVTEDPVEEMKPTS